MGFMRLVIANLFRNKVRTVLTTLSVFVALFLFCALRGLTDTLEDTINVGAESRLITRNKVSLVFPLPMSQFERIKAIPGVSAVTWSNWFGGTDPVDPRNFFGVPASVSIDDGGNLSPFATVLLTAPIPVVSGVNPSSVTAGSVRDTLSVTINGSRFLSSSTAVLCNDQPIPFAVVSDSEIIAQVPASFLAQPGTLEIEVQRSFQGISIGDSATVTVVPVRSAVPRSLSVSAARSGEVPLNLAASAASASTASRTSPPSAASRRASS